MRSFLPFAAIFAWLVLTVVVVRLLLTSAELGLLRYAMVVYGEPTGFCAVPKAGPIFWGMIMLGAILYDHVWGEEDLEEPTDIAA
ncbi:MAG: hypothetical protein QOE22_629 [Candidatus Parcubacteria bacterium]|jgi:hypothetical protein|nr:hypothetical protein [Candidatus Parcubacteria bacterium]